MELEIGGSGQFQRKFAVTKFMTVLIFAHRVPLGASRSSPKQLGIRRSSAYLVYGWLSKRSCGEIGIDLWPYAKNSPYFTATDVGVPSELAGSGGSS